MLDELAGLRAKCKEQARQIRYMQEAAERRNRELTALRQIWCSGHCGTRWEESDRITQEIADEAVVYFRRFATKAKAHGCRIELEACDADG